MAKPTLVARANSKRLYLPETGRTIIYGNRNYIISKEVQDYQKSSEAKTYIKSATLVNRIVDNKKNL